MNKFIRNFIKENNAVYAKMLIESANLDLKPCLLQSGEREYGHYFDKEKGISFYLRRCSEPVECIITNSDLRKNEREYRISVYEHPDNRGVDIYYYYFGLESKIHINIMDDKIELSYKRDGKDCHPGVYCTGDGEVRFKTLDGQTQDYVDPSTGLIVCMVEAIFQNMISDLGKRIVMEDAEVKFSLVKPVLEDAISRVFVKAWKERLTNYKNKPTSSLMERSAGSIIENENCEFVNCNVESRTINYQNDEIFMGIHDLNSNQQYIGIQFKDEKAKKNKVEITRKDTNKDRLSKTYVTFTLKDGSKVGMVFHDVEFTEDGSFDITNLDGTTVTCSMDEEGELDWYDEDKTQRCNFNIMWFGIQNFVDRIHWSMTRSVNNPEFERLFEIIKPALVELILEMNINRVKNLYGRIERNEEEKAELERKIPRACRFEVNKFISRREDCIIDNERYKQIIADTQDSILEEFCTSKEKTN